MESLRSCARCTRWSHESVRELMSMQSDLLSAILSDTRGQMGSPAVKRMVSRVILLLAVVVGLHGLLGGF